MLFKRMLISCVLLVLVCSSQRVSAQMIHSHNDYEQERPFFEAYAEKANIIEVDLYLSKGKLKVCHNREDIETAKTVEEMYLEPIKNLSKKGEPIDITLMIDIKDTHQTLFKLFELLDNHYKEQLGDKKLKLLVCGDVPNEEELKKYPPYVQFDARLTAEHSAKQLERIGLYSMDFKLFSQWNGKGTMPRQDALAIKQMINKVHAMGKPIRFWGAPDNLNTWKVFTSMHIDVLNTDNIAACSAYVRGINSLPFTQKATTF